MPQCNNSSTSFKREGKCHLRICGVIAIQITNARSVATYTRCMNARNQSQRLRNVQTVERTPVHIMETHAKFMKKKETQMQGKQIDGARKNRAVREKQTILWWSCTNHLELCCKNCWNWNQHRNRTEVYWMFVQKTSSSTINDVQWS